MASNREIIKVNPDRERLLAYASGILGSTLSNPGNIYTAEQLIGTSIRTAQKLIDIIFDDKKLDEVLNAKQ